MIADQTIAEIGISLQSHVSRRRWELGDDTHDADMVGLMLCDLMVFAKARGIDFDHELTHARETFVDCYTDDDFAPRTFAIRFGKPGDSEGERGDERHPTYEAAEAAAAIMRGVGMWACVEEVAS